MSLENDGGSPRTDEPPARRVLDDPVVLRAFAHPLRLALHRLLIREGSCSAAYAARELGISQALASHHLHQLSKYGFAEQLAGRDRRERPWRALSTSTTWLGADTTDEGAVAADILEQTLAEQSISNLLEWQQRRREPDQADWHDVAGLDTSLLYLTSEEADDLRARLRGPLPALHRAATRPGQTHRRNQAGRAHAAPRAADAHRQRVVT